MTRTETRTETDRAVDRACRVPERDRRNTVRMLATLLLWAIVFVVTGYAIKRQLLPPGWISWVVAAVPTVLLLVAMLAYAHYIRQADELQRTIQLQALALGLGGGWLALSGYPLFERLGAPLLDAGDYVAVMAAFFIVGILQGMWRYR